MIQWFMCILNFYFLIVVRRINELKSEIDISDDMVKKFEQFWVHFKDSPLKGGILITHFWHCLNHLNSYFWNLLCLSRYLWFYIVCKNLNCTTQHNSSPMMFDPTQPRLLICQIWLMTVLCEMNTLKPFQTDPGRNAILRAICPQVFGLFTVKLAGKHIHIRLWLFTYASWILLHFNIGLVLAI